MYTPELPYKDLGFSSNSAKDLQDQKVESTVYVQDWGKHVIHSINCVDLINCTCTPLSVSATLEEKRKQWWIDNHNLYPIDSKCRLEYSRLIDRIGSPLI
jgi:hypothetical protein